MKPSRRHKDWSQLGHSYREACQLAAIVGKSGGTIPHSKCDQKALGKPFPNHQIETNPTIPNGSHSSSTDRAELSAMATPLISVDGPEHFLAATRKVSRWCHRHFRPRAQDSEIQGDEFLTCLRRSLLPVDHCD
jgi:hypothetical protein